MPHIAAIEGNELAAIFGAFAVLLTGFYAFAAKLLKEARKERGEERKEFSASLEKLRTTIDNNTKTAQQLNEFLVNLNGSLKKTVKHKQKHRG